MCFYVRQIEREREAVSSRRGLRDAERQWQTWPEERESSVWERQPLRDGMLNPFPLSQPSSSSSQPVCFTMVTRQGSQCSRLMCFSAASASWVLMCLSLSPAQSMSTVLGCTNTRGGLRARERWDTLARRQDEGLRGDLVNFDLDFYVLLPLGARYRTGPFISCYIKAYMLQERRRGICLPHFATLQPKTYG